MNISHRSVYQGWAFKLIIINVVIFIIQVFTEKFHVSYTIQGTVQQGPSIITYYLGLIPAMIVEKGYIWQIFSYMFLHSTYSFAHIFFNMYALLIFGLSVEQEWGSKRFLIYYLFCGTFAGLTIFIINFIHQGLGYIIPTIGASGAIFGLLLAFGILFPNTELLLFFVLPVKAKYLVVLYAGIELFLELFGSGGSVSHIGHLGGLFAGLIYFFIIKRRSFEFKYKLHKAESHKLRKKPDALTMDHDRKDNINSKNKNMQINILNKLRKSGAESLTDDEIQYIKYIEIMIEDMDETVLCNEDDLDINDEHCKDCENFHLCFIREVRKYMKN